MAKARSVIWFGFLGVVCGLTDGSVTLSFVLPFPSQKSILISDI